MPDNRNARDTQLKANYIVNQVINLQARLPTQASQGHE